jgi:hypothetical protein
MRSRNITVIAMLFVLAVCTQVHAESVGVVSKPNEIVGTVAKQTTVSGYGRWLAWSAWDPRLVGYRLVVYEAGKGSHVVPVAARSVPFDVDLGPDADGRATAVYSRCKVEVDGGLGFATARFSWVEGGGCDVFRLDIRSGHERRVPAAATAAYTEAMPSLWRGRLVFFRRLLHSAKRTGVRDYALHLQTARLNARSSTRVPGAPTRRPDLRPKALDLYGNRVVYTQVFGVDDCSSPTPPSDGSTGVQTWLLDLKRHTRTVISNLCNQQPGLLVTRPTLGPFGLIAQTAQVPYDGTINLGQLTTGPPIRARTIFPMTPYCTLPTTAQFAGGLVTIDSQDPACNPSSAGYSITVHP